MARFKVLGLNWVQPPSSILAASGHNWIFSALAACLAQEWSTSHEAQGSQGHVSWRAHQLSDSKDSWSSGGWSSCCYGWLEPWLLSLGGRGLSVSRELGVNLTPADCPVFLPPHTSLYRAAYLSQPLWLL